MPRIRTVLFTLLALITLVAPAPVRAQDSASAPATTAVADVPAQPSAGGLPAVPAPPRTLRAYWHVFTAFTVAWVLLFGYVVVLARRTRRIEQELDARGS